MKKLIAAFALVLTGCATANAAAPAGVRVRTIDFAGACHPPYEIQAWNPWNVTAAGTDELRRGGSFWIRWQPAAQTFGIVYREAQSAAPETHAAPLGQWITVDRADRSDVRFRWAGELRVEVQAPARKWQILNLSGCEIPPTDPTFVWPCDDAQWRATSLAAAKRYCSAGGGQ